MNKIFFEIVEEMEQKLHRRLTPKEYDFIKWLIEKHVNGYVKK